MRPRQDVVELFSTFLQFERDRAQGWLSDARLRRHMQAQLTQEIQVESTPFSHELSDRFWALYWHKSWQTHGQRIASDHLIAYVQEPCYWAAQKASTQLASTQYNTADCFQMAIARFDRVLQGFDANQGFSFKNYAGVTFASLIREVLRQRQEIDICTDWALLRKLSQKRLMEALRQAGLPTATQASYRLAWNCFRTLYTPTQATATRKLPKPDDATLGAIAQRYNRDRPMHLSAEAVDATPAQVEHWLLACAQAARRYLYPSTLSINAPRGGEDGGEWLDNVPDLAQTSLLAQMVAEEEAQTRQQQRHQLHDLLTEAIARLSPDLQTILALYYGQGLTQQDMAHQLDTKQYTVSRRLTKAREQLLTAIAQWSRETLHSSPTTDVLTHTSAALEEWLKTHYQSPDLPPVAERSP